MRPGKYFAALTPAIRLHILHSGGDSPSTTCMSDCFGTVCCRVPEFHMKTAYAVFMPYFCAIFGSWGVGMNIQFKGGREGFRSSSRIWLF